MPRGKSGGIAEDTVKSLRSIPILKHKKVTILSDSSKRSRPWLYVSLMIVAFAGIYLSFAELNYLGFANFGNFWGILMLVKHLPILAWILLV